MLAASKRDKWQDATLRVLAISFYATPVFFAGLLLKLVFSVWLGWFPVSGRAYIGTEIAMSKLQAPTGIYWLDALRSGNMAAWWDIAQHSVLPAVAIITVMGLQIALLLGGAVLTETTFEWKGLGFQLAQYLTARDFVAVQGIVALLAVIVAITNFIVDVIAALIDPRVRY